MLYSNADKSKNETAKTEPMKPTLSPCFSPVDQTKRTCALRYLSYFRHFIMLSMAIETSACDVDPQVQREKSRSLLTVNWLTKMGNMGKRVLLFVFFFRIQKSWMRIIHRMDQMNRIGMRVPVIRAIGKMSCAGRPDVSSCYLLKQDTALK